MNLVTIGPVGTEEKSFEIVDGRRRKTTDDGRRRMTEPAYSISSPGAFGSGELKNRYPCCKSLAVKLLLRAWK